MPADRLNAGTDTHYVGPGLISPRGSQQPSPSFPLLAMRQPSLLSQWEHVLDATPADPRALLLGLDNLNPAMLEKLMNLGSIAGIIVNDRRLKERVAAEEPERVAKNLRMQELHARLGLRVGDEVRITFNEQMRVRGENERQGTAFGLMMRPGEVLRRPPDAGTPESTRPIVTKIIDNELHVSIQRYGPGRGEAVVLLMIDDIINGYASVQKIQPAAEAPKPNYSTWPSPSLRQGDKVTLYFVEGMHVAQQTYGKYLRDGSASKRYYPPNSTQAGVIQSRTEERTEIVTESDATEKTFITISRLAEREGRVTLEQAV